MLAQCGVMLRSSPSPVATVVLVAVPLAVLPASTPGLVWALVLVLDAVDDDFSRLSRHHTVNASLEKTVVLVDCVVTTQ